MGWLALFICYFVLVSRKGLSGWWALGGLCLGLNLPLYVLLLFAQPLWNRRRMLAPLPVKPFGWDRSRRAATSSNSFACETCDALLNYGVSACSACGERYRYDDGKPLPVDD